MKLYMEQDTFRWGVPFPIRDKSGRTRYTVTGNGYSLGKRLHVADLAGREAIFVRQIVPSLFPRYTIEVYGKPVGEIVKDLTFFHPRYTIDALGWKVVGVVGACDYEISWQNSVVASSRPQQSRDKKVLALESYDRTTELAALGVLLTLNCILSTQEPKHLS